MPPWLSKRHGGLLRPTSCSGSGVGTTPGLARQERGHGLGGRGSSASGWRRPRRRSQVRCATGLLPSSLHASRKTVISTHALSEGTACSWDEFSILGVGLWTVPSSSAPNGSGVLGTCGRAVPMLQRNSWRANLAALQIEVGAFPKHTLPWLDGGARASAHLGRGDCFGGAVGILRGGSGTNCDGADHTQKATCCPAGSGVATLGPHRRSCHNRGPGTATLGPGPAESAGGVWAQRSAGRKARLHGGGFSCSQDRLSVGNQHGVQTLFQARPKRDDFGTVCAVGCDGSSGSPGVAAPYNIWNALLAAMVHFRVEEVLKPLLTTEETGKVALSCRFACDALCSELCDWDEAERG